jgi:hypothetical protein
VNSRSLPENGAGQNPTVLNPFAEIDFKRSGGHDNYNAFQMTLGRRFNSGLTLNSQYTFGRSFGNTAGSNEALTAGNLARTTDAFDYDEGYNNFDVRHTFNMSAIYGLPWGKGLSGVSRALLGGLGGRNNSECPERSADSCSDYSTRHFIR